MELVLSVVALASFVAMMAVWAIVPHPGQEMRSVDAAPEAGAAQALGVN
jgi:hypothetical protein